jgi:hypothetical protein
MILGLGPTLGLFLTDPQRTFGILRIPQRVKLTSRETPLPMIHILL